MNIEQLKGIAEENGVKASVKKLNGMILANINGKSFKVTSYEEFEEQCKALESYVAPEPIELTSRLTEIENKTLKRF